jgi:putative ABC transport system permease protein
MMALVTPLRDVLVGETKQPLVLVFGASLLLLLIACANLSSILIARGYARMREFAIRSVLGASSRRAIRQLLTESLCLCLLGTSAGVVLAWWSQRTLLALAPATVRAANLPFDGRVLIFVAMVVVLSTVLTGLLPALRASRVDLQSVLKSGGRGTVGGGARLRKLLVATQIALALGLLAGAGLLVESFRRVQRVEAGIDPHDVLVMSMNLPASSYPPGREPQFFERLLAEVRAVPGVRSAAVTSIVPFSSNWDRIVVDVEGWRIERGTEKPEGDRYIVSAEYFQTMGVPLRAGRLFDERDRYDGQLVAVVDEVFARRLAGNGSPIGMRLRLPARDSMATVIGVVGHVKQYGLDAPSQGQIYMSHEQYPWRWMVLAVKTSEDAALVAPAVRQVIRRVDPDQPVFDVATVEQHMAERLALRRFLVLLMTAFAGLAVALATIGVYGALAYVVALRRPEIGMRAVLGARPAQLIGMIVAEGMRVGLAGVALGLAAAAAGTRLLRRLLFGVQPFDPEVMIAVAALALAFSCVACLVPAWRAARVDPLQTMRT